MRTVARVLWAAPTTVIGVMLLVAGAWRVRLRVVDGVIEAHGPALAWMLTNLVPISTGASAMTLGHVVIGRDAASLEETRSHERVHVRQCETWGPLFLPAYLAASLIAVWRGRHYYYENAFEQEAYRLARKANM
jgi:hypothetical protein